MTTPTISALSAAKRAAFLPQLPCWTFDAQRDAIRRSFVFADFNAAWGFMNRIALAAERMNHHPEWSNIWNRVEILLTTHDVGGVSTLDVELARQIDQIATESAEFAV